MANHFLWLDMSLLIPNISLPETAPIAKPRNATYARTSTIMPNEPIAQHRQPTSEHPVSPRFTYMAKPDYKLIAAVIVPLPFWWFDTLTTNGLVKSIAWDSAYFKGGTASAIALFLLIPIAEEVVFRGFLQGGLLRNVWFKLNTLGFSRANLATSCAFAGVHLWQHPLILLPGYFAVSLVLGFFRERYGGLLVPVLLHCYYNLGLWAFAG
jgi:membrane protease YdiL (CAAX protease family)